MPDSDRGYREIAKALSGCDAVICATGGGAVTPFDKRAKKVDNQGTKNLVDAAQKAGVGSFVLVSSLLTNAKAVGQDKNPNYVVLQIFGGVLEEKLQVRCSPARGRVALLTPLLGLADAIQSCATSDAPVASGLALRRVVVRERGACRMQAEKYLRSSSLRWTIVRPSGLSNDPPSKVGNVVVGKEDTLFGLDGDPGREISRTSVRTPAHANLLGLLCYMVSQCEMR